MLRDKFKRPAVTERENTVREEQRAGKENWQEILPQVPDGMFRKCGSCKKILYEKDVRDNWYCCPKCGTGFRIDPLTRIRMTADVHSFQEWDADLCGGNPCLLYTSGMCSGQQGKICMRHKIDRNAIPLKTPADGL